MRKLFWWLVILPMGVFAQNIPFISGARSSSLGDISTVLVDAWAVNNNPAAVGFLEHSEIGLYYTNRFMLKALSSQSIAFATPAKLGGLGVSVERFGYSEYAEMQFGVSYSKAINPYISLGAKFNYLWIHQSQSYGDASAVLVQMGIFTKPYRNLSLAAHIYNPTLSKLNTKKKQKLPTILSFGMGYQVDKRVLLMAQIDKYHLADMQYKIGVETNLKQDLYLRAGVHIHPNAYSLGVAYYLNNIKLDLSFVYQQVLGLSPGSSLGYVFGNKRIQ